MKLLIILPFVSTAIFYLLSYARITQFLWSRYPKRLDSFLSCAACTGFWLNGALCYILGRSLQMDFLGLSTDKWSTIIIAALSGMVWVSILSHSMISALAALGNTEEGSEESAEPSSENKETPPTTDDSNAPVQ